MFVTLGGIDKAGHMWGADQDTEGHDCSGRATGQVHVDCAAKIADAQLGRMLDKLEALGKLDDTLIVLTADHGATHGGLLTTGPVRRPSTGRRLRAQRHELVLRARRRIIDGGVRAGVQQPVSGARTADRDQQRPVLLPVHVDPGMAEGRLGRQEGSGDRDHADVAGRDRGY